MIAAAEALAAAANGVTLGTVYGCGIEEKGSGNWGYWVLYSGQYG